MLTHPRARHMMYTGRRGRLLLVMQFNFPKNMRTVKIGNDAKNGLVYLLTAMGVCASEMARIFPLSFAHTSTPHSAATTPGCLSPSASNLFSWKAAVDEGGRKKSINGMRRKRP